MASKLGFLTGALVIAALVGTALGLISIPFLPLGGLPSDGIFLKAPEQQQLDEDN